MNLHIPTFQKTTRSNNSGSTKYPNPLSAVAAKLRKSSRSDFPRKMRRRFSHSGRQTRGLRSVTHTSIPRHREKRINQFWGVFSLVDNSFARKILNNEILIFLYNYNENCLFLLLILNKCC